MCSATRCVAWLGLPLLLATVVQAQDASTQTAQLVYTALSAPDLVISRPTERDYFGPRKETAVPRQVSRSAGNVASNTRRTSPRPDTETPESRQEATTEKRIQFGDRRNATIDLGGTTISMVANSDGTISVRGGGRDQLLRPVPKLGTLQSAFFTLGENRKYLLAFSDRTGTGANMALACRSGAAQVGTIDGESIWVYDSNTDGVYSLNDDAVRSGDPSKVAIFAPLASHLTTPSGIYQIVQLSEDGSQLQYKKYSGPTGQLGVKFVGGSTELNMVIVSADGQLSTIVTAGTKARPPVMLIPGHYRVAAAIIIAPGSGKVVSVIDTASLPSIDIAGNKASTLEFGSPLTLEFKAALKGDTEISIDSSTVKVRGKSGEAYSITQWTSPPEVSVVIAGAVTKLGKYDTTQRSQTGSGYTSRIPEIRGHARAKIVITGSVEGLGSFRGESQLE
jgi:hypothetical protein